jgi:hypothetical protein
MNFTVKRTAATTKKPSPNDSNDTHTVDTHVFTTSSNAKDDHLAETINLVDETLAMCRDDIPGSITMIVDSGRRITYLTATRACSRPT